MIFKLSLIFSLVLLTSACGEEDDSEKFGQGIFNFDATEIVGDATPDSLDSSTSLTQAETISEISQIRDRLYLSQAESTIPNMIDRFQGRLDELNARVAGYEVDTVPACISATPVNADITTPDGQIFSIKVQCYEELSDTSFMIWGVDDSGVSYIFERSSASVSVVKVTPNDDGTNSFDGYLSSMSTTENEAGAIVHIVANQSTQSVQASMVAPHEVCGVNLYANATKIHFTGSISTGTANSCPVEANYVYSATDLSESTDFDGTLLFSDTFFLKRTAGSKLVNGQVQAYEEYTNTSGAGNVSLSYNADPAASTTDVNFGPATADALGGAAFISQ